MRIAISLSHWRTTLRDESNNKKKIYLSDQLLYYTEQEPRAKALKTLALVCVCVCVSKTLQQHRSSRFITPLHELSISFAKK